MGVEQLAGVVSAYGLGELRRSTFLPVGAMNRSWRVDTATGSYAVKHVLDSDAETMARQHTITTALADKGFPIARPLRTETGDSVLRLGDDLFSVVTWAEGEHPDCLQLSREQCRRIGVLLGELQLALAVLLPPTPRNARTTVPDPARTFAEIERYLAQIDALAEPDDFDAYVRERLPERRDLLRRWMPAMPPERELGPYGWTHGDFHDNNLLWANGSVQAVIDWDRLRVHLLANELVRSASFMFARGDEPPDLERVSAYAAGYRSVIDLTDDELAAAADVRLWHNLTGLWPLDMRYDRGDTSADFAFVASSRLLPWWCDNRAAFNLALLGDG
ncbi:phosphotransferase enzyme family protein [Flindersiella endophytica]